MSSSSLPHAAGGSSTEVRRVLETSLAKGREDPELVAMKRVDRAIRELSWETASRVLCWAAGRNEGRRPPQRYVEASAQPGQIVPSGRY